MSKEVKSVEVKSGEVMKGCRYILKDTVKYDGLSKCVVKEITDSSIVLLSEDTGNVIRMGKSDFDNRFEVVEVLGVKSGRLFD